MLLAGRNRQYLVFHRTRFFRSKRNKIVPARFATSNMFDRGNSVGWR
jgi:hypothetical protein